MGEDERRAGMTKKIAAILIVTLLLIGCGSPQATGVPQLYGNMDYGNWVRFIDTEAGVACWFYDGGLDCMPLSETKLQQEYGQ